MDKSSKYRMHDMIDTMIPLAKRSYSEPEEVRLSPGRRNLLSRCIVELKTKFPWSIRRNLTIINIRRDTQAVCQHVGPEPDQSSGEFEDRKGLQWPSKSSTPQTHSCRPHADVQSSTGTGEECNDRTAEATVSTVCGLGSLYGDAHNRNPQPCPSDISRPVGCRSEGTASSILFTQPLITSTVSKGLTGCIYLWQPPLTLERKNSLAH